MLKFSLIIPTRDRAVLFHRTIAGIWSHTTNKNDVEVIVVCDNDDGVSPKYVQDAIQKWPALNIRMLMRDRTEFSNRDYYNWAGEQAQGELLWIFADDLELVKFNWDVVVWEAYQAYKTGREDNCFCFSIMDNTPPPSARLPKFPCFPMFTRESQKLFGWLLHPAPPNWGADYITYKIFQPLDRLIELHNDNFLNHISYHTHQVPTDATGARIGRIFNKLKMIPKFNTDRILAEEVPTLRQKLACKIEEVKKGNSNQQKSNDGGAH
jgi:hypothetical protein